MILPEPIGIALNMLRRLNYNCHLAGGAVRDTLLERPVKDWDIFVPLALSREDVEKALGVKGKNWLGHDEYATWTGDVIQSADFKLGDLIANVIWLPPKHDDPYGNVERFDWGICKVGIDCDGNLFYGYGWREDVDDKMFRLRTICPAGLEYNMRRFWRLHEKYPDFGLEIPAEYGRQLQQTGQHDF